MTIYDPVVFTNAAQIRIDERARVDSFCKIEGGQGVEIGRHVHIASFCHLNVGGGEVVFEEGSAAASHAVVIAGSNDPAGVSCSAAAPIEQQIVKRWKVNIGKNAILFAGAIVMANVGEGAVVAAGAVVTKDVPPYEIWAGVPARKIGERVRALPGGGY